MMLVRILRGFGGIDLRTFKCPKCDHILKVLVEDLLTSVDDPSPYERDG